MAGSSEMWVTRTRSSPSAGVGTGSSVCAQSLATGSPVGRAASRTWWFVVLIGLLFVVVARGAAAQRLRLLRQPWHPAADRADRARLLTLGRSSRTKLGCVV